MERLIFPLSKSEAKKQGVMYDSNINKNALFPSLLRKLRKEKGLSQEDFSKVVGVTKSTISLYENGDNVPDIKTLSKIAEYFNVSADYLLGRINIPDFDAGAIKVYEEIGFKPDAINEIKRMKRKLFLDENFSILNFFIANGTMIDLCDRIFSYLTKKYADEKIKAMYDAMSNENENNSRTTNAKEETNRKRTSRDEVEEMQEYQLYARQKSIERMITSAINKAYPIFEKMFGGIPSPEKLREEVNKFELNRAIENAKMKKEGDSNGKEN